MDAISTCDSRASGNSAIGASIWSSCGRGEGRGLGGEGRSARQQSTPARRPRPRPGRRERRGRIQPKPASDLSMIVSSLGRSRDEGNSERRPVLPDRDADAHRDTAVGAAPAAADRDADPHSHARVAGRVHERDRRDEGDDEDAPARLSAFMFSSSLRLQGPLLKSDRAARRVGDHRQASPCAPRHAARSAPARRAPRPAPPAPPGPPRARRAASAARPSWRRRGSGRAPPAPAGS